MQGYSKETYSGSCSSKAQAWRVAINVPCRTSTDWPSIPLAQGKHGFDLHISMAVIVAKWFQASARGQDVQMKCVRWVEQFGIEGTGMDFSSFFVDAARKWADELNVASQTDFIREDAANYQAVPDSYDIVSCIGAN